MTAGAGVMLPKNQTYQKTNLQDCSSSVTPGYLLKWRLALPVHVDQMQSLV